MGGEEVVKMRIKMRIEMRVYGEAFLGREEEWIGSLC